MRRSILALFLVLASSAGAGAQHNERFDAAFRRYTKRYFGVGFDWRYFKAQAMAESDLDQKAHSPVGARGLMQLMPSTFQAIATVRPTFEPQRPDFMFGSYNAGEGPITRAAAKARAQQLDHTRWPSIEVVAPTVPRWRYRETLGYVRKIETNYGVLRAPD